MVKDIIKGFKDGHELAWRLFVRDQKVNYRKSLLGFVWVFLPPLATAGIWIFLSAQRVIAISSTPMTYAAFTLCGTLLWSLFAEAITRPIARYQGAMSMMTKLNFPREAILLAAFYDLLLGYCLRILILLPGLWLLGYPPTLYFFGALVSAFALMLGGLGLGIFLTPLGLLYNDISKGLPIGLPFAMYLTPVVYPMRTSGIYLALQGFNPVTPFLERTRSLLGGYEFTRQPELWWWSAILVILLITGLVASRIAMPIIVERAGS